MKGLQNISVRHKLLKRNGKILFKKFSDKGDEHFKLSIFLDGEIEQVESVDYELHRSFKNPLRKVDNKKTNFELVIWTWGEFDIGVTIHFKDGSLGETVYTLKYSDQLVAESNAYIDVS
jgi:transcription initiation factor IIF auxiliary subunit